MLVWNDWNKIKWHNPLTFHIVHEVICLICPIQRAASTSTPRGGVSVWPWSHCSCWPQFTTTLKSPGGFHDEVDQCVLLSAPPPAKLTFTLASLFIMIGCQHANMQNDCGDMMNNIMNLYKLCELDSLHLRQPPPSQLVQDCLPPFSLTTYKCDLMFNDFLKCLKPSVVSAARFS